MPYIEVINLWKNLAEEFPAGWQVTCGWQYGWQVTSYESLIVRHTTTTEAETFDGFLSA